jgi:hypothetical protein
LVFYKIYAVCEPFWVRIFLLRNFIVLFVHMFYYYLYYKQNQMSLYSGVLSFLKEVEKAFCNCSMEE